MKVHGFTLIELLVTLSISAVVLSVVGAFSLGMTEKVSARNEFEALKTIIQSANSKAFLLSKNVVIEIEKGQVSTAEPNADWNLSAKYLDCGKIRLTFNSRGYADHNKITCFVRGKEEVIVINKIDVLHES